MSSWLKLWNDFWIGHSRSFEIFSIKTASVDEGYVQILEEEELAEFTDYKDKLASSGKSSRYRNNSTKENTADEVSVKEFESISMKDLVSKSEGKPEDN